VVKRIVRLDARSYELSFEALSVFRAPRAQQETAESAHEKLAAIGHPAKDQPQNKDMELRTLRGEEGTAELLEAERDLVLAAIEAIDWPTFALARKRRAVELLRNAQAVEV